MLQTIHDKLKGVFAIAILAALGVVFVFWGVDVSVGTFTKARGIEVNGQEIGTDDVQRVYQEELNRYQASFGVAGVPEEIQSGLRTRVLEQAVRSELIRQRTRELRYAASDAEVLEAIRQIPAFQAGGSFSSDAYHAALRSIGMTTEAFEAEQRAAALARQLDRGVSASSFVLPREFERRVALRHEQRELAWVVVPAADFARGLEVDEAAIETFYQAHRQNYRTEESATVEYVEISLDADAASVAIDETRLREYYESVKERYTTAGRRRARHILVEAGGDAAAAEARAKSLYERARQGEDFAALARANSNDPGSAATGGDLGFAERGDFVAAFGDAVWSMKPGEIRGPVRTEFGWHIIKLETIQSGSTRSFDEVRAELATELRRNEVEKAFGDRQEELDRLAFEANGSLAAVAEKMGLPIRRVERFTRAGGGELGASPAVIEAVFAPDMLAGRELRTVELNAGQVIAIRVAGHEPAREKPLAEIRTEIEVAVRHEQAGRLAAARAEVVAAQLSSGAAWESATTAWRGDASAASRQPRLMRRDNPELADAIRLPAFRAQKPSGRPSYGTAALANGDAAIWMVSAVQSGSFAALSPEEQAAEAEDTRARASFMDASAYVVSMRAGADVDVNPQLFE